jgi:5'-nucleotidase
VRALITNDDGIDSPGLGILAGVARAAGFEVTVAAPARESSGASASLLGAEHDGRLLVDRKDCPGLPDGCDSFAVRAAPGLIGFLAAHDGFGPRPDVVLSGVNRGSNTGHAVIHSGTVGAAFSAATHGIHAMAVSIASAAPQHWATAGLVAAHALPWLLEREDRTKVLNVNTPDVPPEQLLGVRKAPLASFGSVQARVHEVDKGNLMVTYSALDAGVDASSDAGLLAAGWATLTLLEAPCYVADAELPEHPEGPPPH